MRKMYGWLSVSAVLATSTIMTPNLVSADSYHATYYSILFNQNSIPTNLSQQLSSIGAQLVDTVPQIGFAEVKASSSAQELTQLQAISGVAEVNPSLTWKLPDTRVTTATDLSESTSTSNATASGDGATNGVSPTTAKYWHYQWDIQEVTHNGASYDLGTGSHQVVVGIIDTGIDATHPDLVNNVMPGSKNFVPAGGYDGQDTAEKGVPTDVTDRMGHGTHVAGTIAGNGSIIGVAPTVGIRSYKVFGSEDAAATTWITKAIVAAANDGVNVISMSLGGYDIKGQYFYTDPTTGKKVALGNDLADYKAYQRAMQYAISKGVLPVVAAGNDGINETNKGQVTNFINANYLTGTGITAVGAGFEAPGTDSGVVTVSATAPGDQLASYSNYGPGFVTVAAPGGDFTRYPQPGWYTDMCLSTYARNLGSSYVWMCGTSMATPKVSAVAALLVGKYGPMSAQKLGQLLTKVAVNPVQGTDQQYFGSGHIDAYDALK